MGLMRWLRGGDDNSAAAGVISAGLAEIDGLFRPSRHKQTEHVEQMKRKRTDLAIAGSKTPDLSEGIAVIRNHKRKRAVRALVGASASGEPKAVESPMPTRQDREDEAVRRARQAAEIRRTRRELAVQKAREARSARTAHRST